MELVLFALLVVFFVPILVALRRERRAALTVVQADVSADPSPGEVFAAAFHELAHAFALKPTSDYWARCTASGDNISIALVYNRVLPSMKTNRHLFAVQISGCSQELSFQSATNATLSLIENPFRAKIFAGDAPLVPIEKRQRTGDEAFDEAIHLAKAPLTSAGFVVLNAHARAKILEIARFAAIDLSGGYLRVRVYVEPALVSADHLAEQLREIQGLVPLLSCPSDVAEELTHMVVSGYSAPRLQTRAYQVLMALPSKTLEQVARARDSVAYSTNVPLKLKLVAAIGRGRAGFGAVQQCLEEAKSAKDAKSQAIALEHLAEHLPSDAMQALTARSWGAWLLVTHSRLHAVAFRCIARFPAAGRVSQLALLLKHQGLDNYHLLLKAIDAQPDPDEAIEAALLGQLATVDSRRLASLAEILRRRGGIKTAVALRAVLAGNQNPQSEEALLRLLLDIRVNLRRHGDAGQLSLTAGGEAGALAFSDPKKP